MIYALILQNNSFNANSNNVTASLYDVGPYPLLWENQLTNVPLEDLGTNSHNENLENLKSDIQEELVSGLENTINHLHNLFKIIIYLQKELILCLLIVGIFNIFFSEN